MNMKPSRIDLAEPRGPNALSGASHSLSTAARVSTVGLFALGGLQGRQLGFVGFQEGPPVDRMEVVLGFRRQLGEQGLVGVPQLGATSTGEQFASEPMSDSMQHGGRTGCCADCGDGHDSKVPRDQGP